MRIIPEGDYVFAKPVEHVLPADFDDEELFEEVDVRES